MFDTGCTKDNVTSFSCRGCLQVHSSSIIIGGSSLTAGQAAGGYLPSEDEVEFFECPELLVACLLATPLLDNEAVHVVGAERFSEVRRTPRWPRSRANFSLLLLLEHLELLELYPYRNAGANLQLSGQPNTFLAAVRRRRARPALRQAGARRHAPRRGRQCDARAYVPEPDGQLRRRAALDVRRAGGYARNPHHSRRFAMPVRDGF